MINSQRMLDEFLELVAIPGPSGREGAVVAAVLAKLRALGLKPRQDRAHRTFGGETGNIIVRVPGSRRGLPTLLLNAHLDTVAQNAPAQPRRTGRYFANAAPAPMGADDKAGVAVILEALRCVIAQRLAHPPLEIVLTVGEEAGLLGAKGLAAGALRAAMGFAFDSSGRVGHIVNQAPSQDSFAAVITGRAAHAGMAPEQGINAIAIAARAIAGMRLGRIDAETTANIGIIEGGVATNVVPERVRVEGEARSHRDAKLDRQLHHMFKRLHDATTAAGGGIDIEVRPQYRSFNLAPRSPVVRVAQAAVTAIGRQLALEPTGGGSDANIFNQHGVPTVVVAIGYDNPHSPSERLEVREFEAAGRLAVEIIRAAAVGSP